MKTTEITKGFTMQTMNKFSLMGIGGLAGSGKDTLYTRLDRLARDQVLNIKFAAPLVEIIYDYLGIEVPYELRHVKIVGLRSDLPYSVYKHSGILAEVPDWFIEGGRSWRELAQYIGTEMLRKEDPDFFIKKFLENVEEALRFGWFPVCTDVRFKNEYKVLDGIFFLIRDDFEPEEGCLVHESELLNYQISEEFFNLRKGDHKWPEVLEHVQEKYNLPEIIQVYETSLDADGELQYTPYEYTSA